MAMATAMTCIRSRVNRARFLIFSLFRSADMGLHYRRCTARPEGRSLVLGFLAMSRSSGDLLRQIIDLADDVVALFGQRLDFIPNQLPLCDRSGL